MDETLKAKLKAIPSTFQTIEFVKNMSPESRQIIVDKLRMNERDLDGYDDEIEEINDLNLSAFLYFSLGQIETAIEINDQVLQKNCRNMNAVACRAWFHLYNSEFSACDKMCANLEDLKKDTLALCIAKSEVGYAWSRLGMKNYPKAEKMFAEALNDSCNYCAVPDYYICIWKFGLALTMRRQFRFNNLHPENMVSLDSTRERCNRTLELFFDIIEMKCETLDKHKARSYVQIGEILNLKWIPSGTIDKQWFERIPGQDKKEKILKCYEDGYRRGSTDVFVIERYACFLRILGGAENVMKSIQLCNSALTIRETSTTHHYLALALKLKLLKESKKGSSAYSQQKHVTQHSFAKGEKGRRWRKVDDREYRHKDLVIGNIHETTSETQHVRSRQNVVELYRRKSPNERDERINPGNITKKAPAAEQFSRKESLHPQNIQQMYPDSSNADMNISPTGLTQTKSLEHQISQEEILLKNIIKSPNKVPPLPSDQIGEILMHLDKAVELNENTQALYDKGLVLRAAGRHDEAICVFKSLFHNTKCSLVQLANTYEQAALCLDERCTETRTPSEQSEMDIKEYLLKSIEIECNIIAKIPILENCWSTFSTLQSLFEETPRSKDVLKEFGRLYNKVQNYREAIGWYKQALAMETDPNAKASTCMEIVRNSIMAKEYTEAILFIDMVLCFPGGRNKVDEALYIRAHIEGGIQSFSLEEKEVAGLRLRNALNYKKSEKSDDPSNTQEDSFLSEYFDVFIVCEPSKESTGQKIMKLLNNLGLSVTLNAESVVGNRTEIAGVAEIIERSTHSVVIPADGLEVTRQFEMYTAIIERTQNERGYGNIVVINESDDIPTMLKGFRSVKTDAIMGTNNDDFSGTKKLLLLLALEFYADNMEAQK